MEQVEQNLAAAITFTFTADGVPVDPDGDATVTVKNSAGTALHTDAETTHGGEGEFSYALLPADTASLDVLTLEWTATLDAVEQTFITHVEVVGGFYFTIAEFLAAYSSDDEVAALDPSAIAKARATAEEIIEGLDTEDGTHVAWVPRAETFTAAGGRDALNIPRYFLRSVDAVTISNEAQSVDGLWVEDSSVFGAYWPEGPVRVVVTHGKDAPPARLKEAAIILAYHRAVKGPIDDRATGRLSPEGSVITLSTPGLRGAVTGIPEVDSAIAQYRKPRIRPLSVSIGGPRYRTGFFDHLDFG